MTPSGIEPVPCQLIAQCVNQLCHCMVNGQYNSKLSVVVKLPLLKKKDTFFLLWGDYNILNKVISRMQDAKR